MSIDERDLAARLDAELGTFAPGPLPLDNVIRQGKMVVLRRRLTAVAAALAVLAAAALAPALINALRRPPPVAPHYHVTVSPPGPGASSRLVATGTVNGARWSLKVWRQRGYGVCTQYTRNAHDCGGGPVATGPGGKPAVLTDLLASARSPGKPYVRVHIVEGIVRGDVTRLRVLLGNGQALTLRPVPVLGRPYLARRGPETAWLHSSWVAVAVPFASAMREVIAYSANGEVGYAVPFTGAHSIEFARWLAPGQPALPAPAHRQIGKGKTDGVSWTVRAFIGPWGLCLRGHFPGLDFCFRAIAHLRPGALVARLAYSHSGHQSLVMLQLAPEVSRLTVTGAAGAPLSLTPVRLGGWGYVVVPAQDAYHPLRWTAYDNAGNRLGTGRPFG